MNETLISQQASQPREQPQAVNNQEPANVSGDKHSPPSGTGKGLLFEIIFVAIFFVLLLAVLNYFNILRVSEIFPNYLGFLPQRKVPTGISQSSNTAITPSPNYSPNIFQYDTQKAKKILSQYIKDNIKPEFLSQDIDIKQGLSIDNRTEDLKHQFGLRLVNTNETISVNFHYKENTNTPNDFMVFIQPSKVGKTTLTSYLANSLVSSYFTNPYSPIEKCSTKGATAYCEVFKTEPDGKKGFGAVIAQDPLKPSPNTTSIVFTCFIPKESKDFDRLQSCIAP